MEEKLFIKNRNGYKISVLLEINPKQRGLVFILHGQAGVKEALHIEAIAKGFRDSEYSVVRFDGRNTIGESEGSVEDASITSYYEDLEDVISWARGESWYQEPFCLSGQSLGGICVGLYAEKNPQQINGLALFSSLVSGKLSFETWNPEDLAEWKNIGFRVRESKTKPGTTIKLKWNAMEDRLKYDLLESVNNLTMPVLMVVGDKDTSAPVAHQKILFEKLQGRKNLYIIKGAEHVFRDEHHLEEVSKIISEWIKSK